VRLVVELYGAGLERTVELAGPEVTERLVEDELVASLLVLHGLHPKDTQTRVVEALDKVRPYLGSHAGGVELLGVDPDGVVHLRLEGSCDGCPSSTQTVKLAIERAIEEAAPEVDRRRGREPDPGAGARAAPDPAPCDPSGRSRARPVETGASA
jgi:Fe-S cluster biogenesis protein NfuA